MKHITSKRCSSRTDLDYPLKRHDSIFSLRQESKRLYISKNSSRWCNVIQTCKTLLNVFVILQYRWIEEGWFELLIIISKKDFTNLGTIYKISLKLLPAVQNLSWDPQNLLNDLQEHHSKKTSCKGSRILRLSWDHVLQLTHECALEKYILVYRQSIFQTSKIY